MLGLGIVFLRKAQVFSQTRRGAVARRIIIEQSTEFVALEQVHQNPVRGARPITKEVPVLDRLKTALSDPFPQHRMDTPEIVRLACPNMRDQITLAIRSEIVSGPLLS